MPPHGHHGGGGRRRGGGFGYPMPFPVFDSGPTVVLAPSSAESCVVFDQLGRRRVVPCAVLAMGDDEVKVIDEVPQAPAPIIRSAARIAAGRLNRGSTPYYRFGAQARSYPFDWHGWPGGVPEGRAAAETRELSGSGDLYESGLSPYTSDYPPLAHRGFKLAGVPLAGLWSDLSSNEQKLMTLGALAVGGLLLFRKLRKAKRKNPGKPRRGRKRRGYRARRRKRWR